MKDYFSSSGADDALALDKPVPALLESGPVHHDSVPLPIPKSPEAMVIGVVTELIDTSIKCFTEYQMCKQHEETERKRIAAELTATLRRIDDMKKLYKNYIVRSFAEREGLYEKATRSIDLALELNDIEMLKVSYNYILGVYERAPSININLG